MIKLPLGLVIYLPKQWQKKYIQNIWDSKTNNDIIESFTDATQWIDLSFGSLESPTTIDIAADCYKRLEERILPQMRSRGLL